VARAYKPATKIDAYIWGTYVGAAAHDPALGYYVFAYDPAFAKQGVELSPLHMPLNERGQPFAFVDLPELTYKRLPAMLADALPDDFGNALVDAYMAERGVRREQITPLDRLAYMGKRAMGALEFVPSLGPKQRTPTALDLSDLVSLARAAVRGTLGVDKEVHSTLRQMIEVGTSAGGARAKAVVAWNPSTQEIRTGQLEAPTGFEHWLLKFDGIGVDHDLGSTQGYGRIEYAYHLMARAAGISMSECRLLEEHGRAHFMTKRFDRGVNGVKHHMQTLCAIDHLDYKKVGAHAYEQLFFVSQHPRMNLGHATDVEIFRRMVFNVMARNCDDHTKNVSFRLQQGSSWELAPAYDVTFSYNPASTWVQQHQMSVSGKFRGITRSDCLKLADRFGVGEASAVIREVRRAVMNWPEFAAQAEVSAVEAQRIAALHETAGFA